MQTYTLPDIEPAGSAASLGAAATSAGAPTRAVWINMTASGTSIRVGDANVSSARGQALPTSLPFNTHPRGDNPQQPYDLAHVYVYGSSTDKVSITYGY
jgi:hypothetical protein